MAVTYTYARQRDARQALAGAGHLDTHDRVLLSATLVGVLLIALTYAGVASRVLAASDSRRAIDLRTVGSAQQLEPAFEPLFPNPADRRFAARELFASLAARRTAREPLPSVGAALSVQTAAAAVDATPGLLVYAERLRAARERAAGAAGPPQTIRLLTPADIASIKARFVVRSADGFARQVLLWGAVCMLACYGAVLLWRIRAVQGDRLLLAAAHLLTAFGFAALVSRVDPLRDALLFVRYAIAVAIGLGLMSVVSLIDFRKTAFVRLSYIPLAAALLLSLVLIVFGHGPGTSGAKVNLGPVQPIEAIRLLLALFLAGYFARRWELLRQTPRLDYVLPLVAGVAAALLLFFLQKDLGPALFLACIFLVLYSMATGRVLIAVAGSAVVIAGFYVGYLLNISDTITARIEMWRSPWHNAVRGGDQIAQSIWALATGGVFGSGPGMGDTRYLPAGHTDLVLAAVGEELGLAGLIVVAAAYATIAWRGLRIALSASSDYAFFLASALMLVLLTPVLVMCAGILGVIPLTGVVTPFLSYGGSAMVANWLAVGILAAIHATPSAVAITEPFRTPIACVAGALGTAAVAVAATLGVVQLVRADDYASRPHVSVQGDGVARRQYNPRMLDLARTIPRGTIYDRAGVPLATSDSAVLARARDGLRKAGVDVSFACGPTAARDGERCYPLGGATFHLLGDVERRLNWSATNSSYVERDADGRLRGFGSYRELVPALRNRHDREDGAVVAVMEKNRDVRLALDARLQAQVASILAGHAQRFSSVKAAAAVVLDPETGGVLAMASYPWPGSDSATAVPQDALFDRARYGLYPPGSTFKLVTAAAALRHNASLSRRQFSCTRLPNGRVGARLPGVGLVRDDVLETHAHGAVDMREGIVHSCNAYFAQLATDLGAGALADTGAALGLSLTPSNSLPRLQATLPHAAYGQGDVVVTPLRMARVAAAIASGGVLRDVRLEAGAAADRRGEMLLSARAARVLGGYMRDAVLAGTGQSLRTHPGRIAGKTGTAEVAGAASHAWFVGFAPHGPATKRIAFAVIVENAGYGSRAAAPLAGEIVSAAAASGLVR